MLKNNKWGNLFIIFVLVTLTVPIRSLVLRGIPFWYDPGRDLLSAHDTMQKLTLIGQPSGIPGIFYLPYWIWLLALAMRVSPDPSVIAFLVLTVPYAFIFPWLLWSWRKSFGLLTVFGLWFLFSSNFSQYLNQIWNPHLAPLLTLITLFLISRISLLEKTRINSLFLLSLGICLGLIFSFQIALAIGLVLALGIYILWEAGRAWRATIQKIHFFLVNMGTIFTGLILEFLPFIIFEVRHQFLQINAFRQAVIASFTGQTIVNVTGLSRGEILWSFVNVLTQYLDLPNETIGLIVLIGTVVLIAWSWSKIAKFPETRRLGTFALCAVGAILLVFLKSGNPVWPYHFIGLETIYLVLLGLVLGAQKKVRLIFFAWVVYLFVVASFHFFHPLVPDFTTIDTLASRKQITEIILADVVKGGQSYTVVGHGEMPFIQSYEYNYLFLWLAKEKTLSLPTTNIDKANELFIIIPKSRVVDKVKLRLSIAPTSDYKILWEHTFKDGDNLTALERQGKTSD